MDIDPPLQEELPILSDDAHGPPDVRFREAVSRDQLGVVINDVDLGLAIASHGMNMRRGVIVEIDYDPKSPDFEYRRHVETLNLS
jgi:hypothetical protein